MSLEETAQDLASQKVQLAKRLRNATRRQRYHARLQTVQSISSFLRTVLVLLYVFGGYRVELAQSYWSWQRKRKKLVPLSPNDSKRHIENLFLEVPDENLASLFQTSPGPSEKSAWRRACSWQNKVKLAQWVRKKNIAHGLAPNTRMLVNEYNRIIKSAPFLIRAHDYLDPGTQSSSRVMVHRWRRAVMGKWRSIRVLEYLSLEEKRNKAASLELLVQKQPIHFLQKTDPISKKKGPVALFCGPVSGSISRPSFRIRLQAGMY